MTPDWPIWALGGAAVGLAYGWVIARLNLRRYHGPKRKYVLALEAGIALVLIAVEVCGLTGYWWMMREFALAVISIGGPVMVVLLITGAATGASEEEYGQIDRILGNNAHPVRDASVPGGQTDPDFRKN
ncbi:MAG: hypothetical protein ACYC6L_12715 [Anaerolineae bacterium]